MIDELMGRWVDMCMETQTSNKSMHVIPEK